ncbi:MAG TPA: hypothetical protein VKR31_02265 [Rhizomicrobium sp.]|nr:hypothetical protein [Rhizomicrobium sp.]
MLNRFLAAVAFAALPGVAFATGSMTALKNQPPDGSQLSFLLTDGTVLAQGYNNSDFWVLAPDNTGSYVNGTWKQVGSLQSGYSPSASASQVLADGRVLVEGGEYNFGNFALTNLGAVYDPVKQSWTPVQHPPKWQNIGDSPSVVLADGTFFIGDKLHRRGAFLDPKTMKWTAAGYAGKNDFNAEEGWTLMPDGNVLTFDVQDHPQSEMYIVKKQRWKDLGSTVADLQAPDCNQNCCLNYPPHNKCYDPPGEVGPAVLMPDGTVFATGASDHTAVYTPGKGWAAGPNFPGGDAAGDSFATLLPNGEALVEGNSGDIYIWNGSTLTSEGDQAYGMMTVLPNGQILISNEFGNMEVYTESGTYRSAWQPTISNCPSSVTRGQTYKVSGTQFNGLSQAGGGMGDEYQSSTNYPLVQITNESTGHVFYARTHDHSSMGVATGSKTVSTNFDVSSGTETGASTLVVIANGIPSAAVSITVN